MFAFFSARAFLNIGISCLSCLLWLLQAYYLLIQGLCPLSPDEDLARMTLSRHPRLNWFESFSSSCTFQYELCRSRCSRKLLRQSRCRWVLLVMLLVMAQAPRQKENCARPVPGFVSALHETIKGIGNGAPALISERRSLLSHRAQRSSWIIAANYAVARDSAMRRLPSLASLICATVTLFSIRL